MTPTEFEDLLVQTRMKLTESFKEGKVSDLEICTKLILDYNELVSKSVFNAMENLRQETQAALNQLKGDILKDIRERHAEVMTELKEH